MYTTKFKEEEKTTIVAPKGTVFIKVGSHRARDYMTRYDVPYISFHNLHTNIDLNLIYETDYPKLERVKGISKPVIKIVSKGSYRQTWSSNERTPEEKKLKDLFDKANPRD